MHATEFQFLEYAVNAMTATKGRRNFCAPATWAIKKSPLALLQSDC